MSDPRSQTRVSLPVIGKLDLGSRSLPCVILDISEGGLALLTSAGELVDGPVQVTFRLGTDSAAKTSIDAQVICQEDDRFGMSSRWSLRSFSACAA